MIGVTDIVTNAIVLLNVLYFQPKTSEPIRIGGILMLTGAGTNQGLNSQKAAGLPIYSVLLNVQTIIVAEGTWDRAIALISFTPNQESISSFINKYGVKPDIVSDTSYDTIKLIAKAIEETARTDPNVLKDCIRSLDEYERASDTLKFDGRGGIKAV